MLIQPYVENSLKHGLLHKENDKQLNIDFTQKNENTINCTITDNGIGREASSRIKTQVNKIPSSFSSQAVKNRLSLLNELEDVHVGVQIVDLTNSRGGAVGTKVILNIPILKS